MAEQGIPPDLMAALGNGNGAPMTEPPPTDPREQVDPASVTNKLLIAVGNMADKGSMATIPAEANEAAKAALAFAQAVVILDPNLGQDGAPLEHQLEMERIRGQEQRATQAAAPEPARGVKPRP